MVYLFHSKEELSSTLVKYPELLEQTKPKKVGKGKSATQVQSLYIWVNGVNIPHDELIELRKNAVKEN